MYTSAILLSLCSILCASFSITTGQVISGKTTIRWCAPTQAEYDKCQELVNTITTKLTNPLNILKSQYTFSCVQAIGAFGCMKTIFARNADVMNLDVGLGFEAAHLYGMRPFMIENYAADNSKPVTTYYSNIVVPKNVAYPSDLNNWKDRKACFSGVGTAEGWVMPMSQMVDSIGVKECNSIVKIVSNYFGESCAPNSRSSAFDLFGENPNAACKLCKDLSQPSKYCTMADQYANSAGALYCLHDRRGSASPVGMAFVRSQTIDLLRDEENFPADQYQLFCPKAVNGSRFAPLTAFVECSWGSPIQSRILMTNLAKLPVEIAAYKTFFTKLVEQYGLVNSPDVKVFNLFNHLPASLGSNVSKTVGSSRDLMFSDFTKNLIAKPETEIATFHIFAQQTLKDAVNKLNECPQRQLRWCVISDYEMEKCERMKSALDSKRIKPAFNCVQGSGKLDCMNLIGQCYADMTQLDAAEMYTGGRYFNLVPFAAENYGGINNYYAVAIAKKWDPDLLVSNMRNRRTCHSGVGKATGWVVAMNLALDTQQIRVPYGNLIQSYGELVSRACIPGIMNPDYNDMTFVGLNLCEICAAGGLDRCRRDNRELYYGDGGAFRCLVESGDIAFAKHTTIMQYTGGKRLSQWGRNLRADDYELLCSDGSRREHYDWKRCNLGSVPGSVIATGSYKTAEARQAMWRILRFAQEYYSSPNDPVFQMFHSGFDHYDLMFSDSASRLDWIPAGNQTYQAWIGRSFTRQVENLLFISGKGKNGIYSAATKSCFANAFYILFISLFFNISLYKLLY